MTAMPQEAPIRSMKDLPQQHLLAPGTPLCAGCGALAVIKQFYDQLGKKTVFVNAASCTTLLVVYPYSPLAGSWVYTSMASAPAGAQGVRDALDILRSKGRLSADDDLQVVVLTGDGSANGMGLSATSGAIERGLDFYYLVYDNEGYGNTGHQTSPATPRGARTATATGSAGLDASKKDLFSIWAAHRPGYLATVAANEPLDLAQKIEHARGQPGAKLFISLAPCPTGWHFDPRETLRIDRLAVQTGVWPLKELVQGHLRHTRPPKAAGKRPPVADYLRTQGRFAHLFTPRPNAAVLQAIQDDVDAYWAAAS